MIKELVSSEEELSKPSEPATAEDAQVAQDLYDTVEGLGDECLCLAANQIGELKNIIAFRDEKDDIHVMFNPRIKQAKTPYKTEEGCLSLTDRITKVSRYLTVKIAFEELVAGELQPRVKQYDNLVAEGIQHALDHCRGRLV